MKIIIDLSYIRLNLYAGVSKYAYRILDGFLSMGVENEYILLINYVSKDFIIDKYPQFEYVVIGNKYISKYPFLRTLYLSYSFRREANKIESANVILCPWGNEITFLPINKLKVSVIHDFQSRKVCKGFRLMLQKVIDFLVVNNSNRIVTISDYSKQDILKFFPKIENLIVNLGNSVDFKDSCSDRMIAEPYLLNVSTPLKQKNQITILKAFNLIKDKIPHKLCFVSGSGNNWEKEIVPFVCNNNLQDRVIRFSNITDEELNSLYKFADVFIISSLREGFGSPPIEAMVWGTPVLSSNAESLPEATMNKAVYFNPLDYEELSNDILNLLEDYPDKKKLKRQSEYFRTIYDKVKLANRIHLYLKSCKEYDFINYK